MALRTRLDLEDARTLCDAYGLCLESCEPLPAHGTVNSNFRLRASGRVFFLRLNEGKRDGDVLAEVALVEKLRGRGVPTPEIVRARDGRALVAAKGRQAMLFPWLDAREAAPDPSSAREVALVGAALATLHRAGELGEAELPRNHYSLDELERRLGTFAGDSRFAGVVPGLAEELARARRRAPARARLRAGLIHQDLFPDNLLVDGEGGLVALLDFEQATYGAFVYDLAVALNAWCWTGSAIAKAAMGAVLSAYEAARPLDADERQALVDEARLAAARFCITRITDVFLPGDTDPELRRRKDYRDYARRLAWWRQL